MDKQYRLGVLCIVGATVAWSSAGLIARLAATPTATTLFWRSGFAFLFILCQIALTERGGMVVSLRRIGVTGTAMAVAFAVSMAAFINALTYMRVANVLVFHAASPFFAALLAWVFIRERPRPATLLAVCVSLGGVAIMVAGAMGPNDLMGDALSAVMALSFAVTIVLARVRPDLPVGAVTALSMLIMAVTALPWADLTPSLPDLGLLAAFGIGQMGVGSLLFTAGAKRVPAADAGLLSVLETVLGPLWVWLAVDERPDAAVLAGGGLVLAAVLMAGLAEQRRRMAAAAVSG
jgi:drug/metabolite transporter (DMT)-like permease